MTNKINYLINVNGRVVKSGIARVDNRNLARFEQDTLAQYKFSKNDKVEMLFR